ncbi:hypothetical protein F4677DRAFT_333655 [Hypoxylon crocopeplum]|nr:hypothetical protein F4677DRAFT_333655 [Hypoxylon crocopeplum]
MKMKSINSLAYEMMPSTSTYAELGPKTPRSFDEHETAKSGQENRAYLRWLSINAALFFIFSIGCGVASSFIPVQSERDIFDPGCADEASNSAEQFFHLDLTFGNFTFTQAKLIDITWDTTIGQGGRLLHGYVFFRAVIYPLLVFAMETSSVTYHYYTMLSFSRTSIETLWELLSTLYSKKSYSVIICTISAIYSLAYIIVFPVIWSAATGYINQAHKLYAMPDGEIIQLNSEHLALCWVLDSSRLGLPTDRPYVEIGPDFSSIQSLAQPYKYTDSQFCFNISAQAAGGDNQHFMAKHLEYTAGGWKIDTTTTIWDHLGDYSGQGDHPEISRNFANIRAYALTAQLLQISLNPTGWIYNGPNTSLHSALYTDSRYEKLNWWSTALLGCTSANFNSLFPSLEALQYEGPSQSTHPPNPETADLAPFNESNFEKTYWSQFTFNASISLDPGVIPYNSTIWLNGSSIPLTAPFLDVGFNCSNNTAFASLGNCVCYEGTPISLELLSDEKAICNTAPGYVWGFSSSLTRLGLVLEAVWMVCCFLSYLLLSHRSRIIKKDPIRTAGTMRLAFDCSESARHDLGVEVDYLTEKELANKLKGFKISYEVLESEQNKGMRYRVVSGREVKGFRHKHDEHLARLDKKLSRLDKAFVPINERVDPISDHMNKKVDQVSAYVKERYGNTDSIATDFEVYEDLNWRIYQDHTV